MPLPTFEATIHSLSHDGRGIAMVQGKTTFVSGALPNEHVLCKLTKKHRRYNEAVAVEILSPAPERIQPECQHFNVCGGCSLQHLNTASQIELKQKILLEQLQHFGQVKPTTILQPLSGQTWGYRRKARLGARYVIKKEKLHIGFREKNSNYLTDIEKCLVLHPSIGTRFNELHTLVNALSNFDQIPQIEIAVSDTTTALIFRHLTPFTTTDINALREFGKQYDFHIYLQPNAPDPVHCIWPEKTTDDLSYKLQQHDIEINFHPLNFTQVNAETNQLMIDQAIRLLDPQPDETILDLFCGLGNFTLPIARRAKKVVGIEGSEDMVMRACANARHNHIENTEFYAENLAKPSSPSPHPSPAAPTSPTRGEVKSHALWLQTAYDKILLDPPRTGAKEIIAMLSKPYPKKIVYVSCNPATLARDAKELVYTHQYKLTAVGVINMFPHTSHIEAIALFER